jgi:hypothetical protein
VLLQGAAFMVQPLLGRTAYAALHFLELLVGPRCQQLDVENPKVRALVMRSTPTGHGPIFMKLG